MNVAVKLCEETLLAIHSSHDTPCARRDSLIYGGCYWAVHLVDVTCNQCLNRIKLIDDQANASQCVKTCKH